MRSIWCFIGASNELGQFESGLTAHWFGGTAVVLGGMGGRCWSRRVGLMFPHLRMRSADDGAGLSRVAIQPQSFCCRVRSSLRNSQTSPAVQRERSTSGDNLRIRLCSFVILPGPRRWLVGLCRGGNGQGGFDRWGDFVGVGQ